MNFYHDRLGFQEFWRGGHQLAIEDFIQTIREDRSPRCDGVEGRRSLAVVEEIYRMAGMR